MKGLVSVVVPVYNVEDYIRECFQSILAQQHQNIEVLLVDDGSADSSGAICDEFAGKDNRFKVFHTENRGIGAARNLAMEHMTGEYCFFLDPDDVIEVDTLSYLVELIERTSSDMALAVTRQFRGKYIVAENPLPVEAVYTGHKEICENVLLDKSDLKPLPRKAEPSRVTYEFFSTLYRTKKLRENHISFLPISYGEDTYVCFKSLLTSERVATSTKIVYSHRRNPTSTTFQYHPFYLSETKEYYRFYMGLFEDYAKDYLTQGREGINGQYIRRCCSAIERELTLSPAGCGTREKIATVRQIHSDPQFRALFKGVDLHLLSSGWMYFILLSIRLGVYPLTITMFDLWKKMKRK